MKSGGIRRFVSAAPAGRSSPSAQTSPSTRKGHAMYFHRQELQHKDMPDKPDAVYARKLQESEKLAGGAQDAVHKE
ncbi:hypothetical protein [Microbacterium lushaniae]|uniref:Uncharacterized protein n=1 Tax=Microbacterium lushaniae TaxID=2614639 RepID=A0A5J6L6A7_9MICO|nr:hypothetical protein [Microbacterium lushaniae]QEW03945.1 hypothetical protein F6J85_13175 [Microbacterium lushaniae]